MIDREVRKLVSDRASHRCEYCRMHEHHSTLARLHIEHVVARKHLGGDEADNLALACVHCNLHKGTNLAGLDPLTGLLTPLFHPRQQMWEDHFRIEGLCVVGRTPVGRTTVVVLAMNSELQLELRAAAAGEW